MFAYHRYSNTNCKTGKECKVGVWGNGGTGGTGGSEDLEEG